MKTDDEVDPRQLPLEDLEAIYDFGCSMLIDVTRALAHNESLARDWRGALLRVHTGSLVTGPRRKL